MADLRLVEDIVRLTNRRAEPLDRLLGRLKVSQKQFDGALEVATHRGYQIRVSDGYVFSKVASRAEKTVVVGDTKPGRYKVGVWTDTHWGCKHTDEEGILEHLHRCWDAGCRVMVHGGDNLDGNRPVLLGDQKYVGFDSQFGRLLRTVRKAPPLVYIAIDGNHDGYYSSSIGAACGAIVASRMRELGIQWTFAGVCEGRATIHGADWFLWHPEGGSKDPEGVRRLVGAKARELTEHCDILLAGHLHKFVSFDLYPEHVHGICSGTFQRQKSEFANRMVGPWHIGGSIASYDVDKDQRVSSIAVDFFPSKAA